MSAIAEGLIETIISDVLIRANRLTEAKQGINDRGDAEDLLDYLPQN
jgi:hypothetical protein